MTIDFAIRSFTQSVSAAREKKLVAVSGGRDSVALLHALHEAGHRRLVVCHLDHRLRGRASTGDAAFVKKLAARLGLPLESARADVRREAKDSGLSLEAAGRAARHRFFAAWARRHRCRRMVLAHHANDQAETALLHLFRGAGGLRGMQPVSQSAGGLTLLRPLLCVTREEIGTWLAARRLRWREDASNALPDAVRNRLRHDVLPAICRAMDRDVVPVLLRDLEVSATEDAFMDSLVTVAYGHCFDSITSPPSLLTRHVLAAPLAMQRRILRRWLREKCRLPGIGFREVEAVRAMLPPDGPRAVNLPGNQFIRRRRGLLAAG